MPDYLTTQSILEAMRGPRRPGLGLTEEEIQRIIWAREPRLPPVGGPADIGWQLNLPLEKAAPSPTPAPTPEREEPLPRIISRVPSSQTQKLLEDLQKAKERAAAEDTTPSIQENIRNTLAEKLERASALENIAPEGAREGVAPAPDVPMDEPWEKSAAQAAHQRRLDLMRAMADIGSGMRAAGEGMAGLSATTLGGRPVSFVTPEKPNLALARAEDELSPAEAAMLREAGIAVPEGMSRAALKSSLPLLSETLGLQQRGRMLESTERQRDIQNALAAGRLDIAERNLDLMGERMGSLEGYRELRNRPNERTLLDLSTKVSTLDKIPIVREEYKKAGMTGPLGGRLNRFLVKVGLDEPISTTLRADLVDLLANYLRSISGKTVTETERKLLAETMAQEWQAGDTFEAMLTRFEQRAALELKNDVEALRGVGYRLPPNIEARASGQGAAATGGMVRVALPNGDTGEIPESEVAAFLKKYPGAKRL